MSDKLCIPQKLLEAFNQKDFFMAKYLLIDGNALVHRAFHALPPMTTKEGYHTNAVYGFALVVLKILKELKPQHIILTFDLAGPTFRHEMYEEYKAHRVKAPQELYDQIPLIKELMTAFGIPIFEKEGVEADDVLGTLSKQYALADAKNQVLILTGDMDTIQLVDKQVKVLAFKKGFSEFITYDEKAARERYGFAPIQMIEYKALRGDPSDNIPGVKGIGDVTATQLIKVFGNVSRLYEVIESGTFDDKQAGVLKKNVLDKLVTHKDQALLSHTLATIHRDLELGEVNGKEYEFSAQNLALVVELFQKWQFHSLLSKLPKPYSGGSTTELSENADGNADEDDTTQQTPRADLEQNYTLIDTDKKLNALLREIEGASELVIDTETNSLDQITAEVVGVSLCTEIGTAFYVPWSVARDSSGFLALLQKHTVKKIGHNLKFDAHVLENQGVHLSPVWFDTMIASYLTSGGNRQHSLDQLAFNELGYQMQPIEELIGSGKNQITMDQVPVEKVSWYAAEDADITARLKNILHKRLEELELTEIFENIEMPLVPVLMHVEKNGICLDKKYLKALEGEMEVEVVELENHIYKLAGEKFNLNSPKQMKDILFDKLKLQPVENRKTKTGLSTAAGELEKMRDQHPVVDLVLQYRELAKLLSTYVTTLPSLVNQKTGRIHTSYNQTIASTGRLSSNEPNLQNIPVKEGWGEKVRKAFVAQKGFKLLSLDYSQIELRIVAHLSGDVTMVEVFKNNQDIHTATAVGIFGVAPEAITKDMRREAKAVNFGILYGLSGFGLASQLQTVTRVEAQKFIDKYFATYPKVKVFLEMVKAEAREKGTLRSATGRLRTIPEARASNFAVRAAAERQAMNFPIQSLNADIIKIAMINIHHQIRKSHDDIRMLLSVHDELVFEVKEELVASWASKLKTTMESAMSLSIPVIVEAKIGDNWGEMEKLKIT